MLVHAAFSSAVKNLLSVYHMLDDISIKIDDMLGKIPLILQSGYSIIQTEKYYNLQSNFSIGGRYGNQT